MVLDAIDQIRPTISEFYAAIPIGESVDSVKPFWMFEHLAPTQVVGNFTNADSKLTITGKPFGRTVTRTDMLKILRLNAVLRYDYSSGTVIAKVTAVDPTNPVVTLTATSGTSLPGTDQSGKTWLVIGEPSTDAEDASNPRFFDRDFMYTTTELFSDVFSIEKTRRGLGMQGVRDEYAHQLDLLLQRLEWIQARSVLSGWPEVSGGEPQSLLETERARLCGLDWWPEYLFGSGKDYENSSLLQNLSGAALTQTHINTMVGELDKQGAKFSRGDWRFVTRPEIADYMQDYDLSYRESPADRTTAGFTIEKVRTKRGVDVKISRDWFVPEGTAWFVDVSQCEIHPFKGMEMLKEQLGRTNATSETWQIARRLVGLVLRNAPISVAKIKNISMTGS